MVDITRDPRWGRIMEGAGEDPYLGARIAEAQVRGFQGAELSAPDTLLACVKHFAGYGAAIGGRDYDSVNLSDNELYNVYLKPYQAAVNAGAGSLMSAYMDLNSVPATGNKWVAIERCPSEAVVLPRFCSERLRCGEEPYYTGLQYGCA